MAQVACWNLKRITAQSEDDHMKFVMHLQVSVDECKVSLENLRDDKNPLGKTTFLSKLPEDLKKGAFKDHHQVAKLKTQTQFQNVKVQFINAVLENISRR